MLANVRRPVKNLANVRHVYIPQRKRQNAPGLAGVRRPSGGIGRSPPWARAGEQEMPGFAIFLKARGGAASAEGVEVEGESAFDLVGGNQVPNAVRADVGCEEIYIGRGVRSQVSVCRSSDCARRRSGRGRESRP